MKYVELNTTELIYSLFVDVEGAGITAASPSITIRRNDGQYYDFNDNAFKSSGWTTRVGTMTEVSAANDAGVYSYSFNTTGMSENTYFIRTSLAAAVNSPQASELSVGYFISDVGEVLTDTSTTIPAQISGLNDISTGDVTAAVPTVVDIQNGLKEKRVMLNLAYSQDDDELVLNIWVETEGVLDTSATNLTVFVYNADGVEQFNLNQASSNVDGIFTVRKENPGFVEGKSYYAVLSVVSGGDTITTNKGLVTS